MNCIDFLPAFISNIILEPGKMSRRNSPAPNYAALNAGISSRGTSTPTVQSSSEAGTPSQSTRKRKAVDTTSSTTTSDGIAIDREDSEPMITSSSDLPPRKRGQPVPSSIPTKANGSDFIILQSSDSQVHHLVNDFGNIWDTCPKKHCDMLFCHFRTDKE